MFGPPTFNILSFGSERGRSTPESETAVPTSPRSDRLVIFSITATERSVTAVPSSRSPSIAPGARRPATHPSSNLWSPPPASARVIGWMVSRSASCSRVASGRPETSRPAPPVSA